MDSFPPSLPGQCKCSDETNENLQCETFCFIQSSRRSFSSFLKFTTKKQISSVKKLFSPYLYQDEVRKQQKCCTIISQTELIRDIYQWNSLELFDIALKKHDFFLDRARNIYFFTQLYEWRRFGLKDSQSLQSNNKSGTFCSTIVFICSLSFANQSTFNSKILKIVHDIFVFFKLFHIFNLTVSNLYQPKCCKEDC